MNKRDNPHNASDTAPLAKRTRSRVQDEPNDPAKASLDKPDAESAPKVPVNSGKPPRKSIEHATGATKPPLSTTETTAAKSSHTSSTGVNADAPSLSSGAKGNPAERQTTPDAWDKSDDEQGGATSATASDQATASPAYAVPDLNDVRTLFRHIDYVPDGDKQRILAFAQKKDDTYLRYALGQVPERATWGSTSKTSKILCVDDKPVTIWAVGDVETTWFRDLQGEPHERVNLGFRLPFVFDDAASTKLFTKARPARTPEDVIYAARRMKVYRKGDALPTILPFIHVYDARKRFQAKSQMPKLETSAIGKRDIVLVEAKLTRWNTAKDKVNRRDWKLWDIGFELDAMSLLFEAPPDADPAPAKEMADIDDDM